ncbi:MAG: tRNA (N(6)-L-threonylcarbamoyladenosine(37)-C(2))-methylthiotransferase MtaB [Candidatus Neptunochlamydia sp.]|nr:tRNA (N(6)-L-threonylcarbamoyladenosine(37)-C(2))-methylthiotransferase MtaB [Candidatus Neptunochlamydia sp.]
MKKYKVATLGCRTNQYESQAFTDQLKKEGYVEAKEGDKADLCIVNTCTVTKSADKRSLYQIRKISREFSPEKLVVTGCLAECSKKELEQLDEVTHVVSNQNKENLLPEVFPEKKWPEFQIERFEAHTRAFVKIQDGCNSYCSYCVIPFVRGRSRSKKVFDTFKEIEALVENGYKEIVLTGINIGDFDGNQSPPVRLSDLVRQIDKIPGLERIRISSIDPDEVDDDLIDAVVNGEKTASSMHIVLQSGSNLILKRMLRKYTKQDFIAATTRLLKENPNFTFTTDIIVGFPGETEEEFQETLALMDEVHFAKVHMFPYSDRPKTRASRMPHKVPSTVIQDRKDRLLRCAEKNAYDLRQTFIGNEFSALLETEEKPGYLIGHTENFLPIYVPKENLRPNTLIKVKCTGNNPEGLIGENQTHRTI